MNAVATLGDAARGLTSRGRRVWRVLPLVALLATGGCFATRNDVRIVQSDVASLRTELLRNDVQQAEALTRATKLIATLSDSLARLSTRTVSLQGDVRGEMRGIKEQLLQVQTLLGQSQATIARLRAELEARNNAIAAAPPALPPASSSGTTGGASGTGAAGGVTPPSDSTARGPGPAQLFQNGKDQLQRGSTSTARTIFQELLSNFPASDLAPDAQFFIGQSLLTEKNLAGADAAFGAVVAKYPESQRASTALYKQGDIALQQGNKTNARKYFSDVVARYPKSLEASLAADRLLEIR